jgi:2-methylcitrate dehydratase PrpD
MTYIDDIVTFIATAEPEADERAQGWPAVRTAVDTVADGAPAAETAYAVGCAVAEKVAAVLDSTPGADGWSRASVAGAIGAGAAVGRLMELDDTRLRHLLGLCATQATGLRSLEGTEAGTTQVDKAASDAVEAALLVSNGFTSSADGLAGRRGLFALMAPGAGSPSW